MPRVRLDVLLTERGLVDSRARAQALIMAGQVRVAGQVALKPGAVYESDSELTIDPGPRFVSRGGEKLEAALAAFGVEVRGRVCADVGASTGGFTDCLLQRGAARVYAVDVGKGILHWKLRNDPRVVVLEQTNARHLESLPERVSLVTVDVSFISLKIVLPVIRGWLPPATQAETGGSVVALIKPQFEAGRRAVSRGSGVIRDPEIHRQVLDDVLGFTAQAGLALRGLVRSSVLGPKGNVEFLAWLETGVEPLDRKPLIDAALTSARE
jgi:23S rRNA (cytidine1920-2'-O)/16S rRNA (cytidine1409-2'-O)-methyltransferase